MPRIYEAKSHAEAPLHAFLAKFQPFDRTDGKQHKQAEAVAPQEVPIHGTAAVFHETERFHKPHYCHHHNKSIFFIRFQLPACAENRQCTEQNGAHNCELCNIRMQREGIPRPEADAVAGVLTEQNGVLPENDQSARQKRRTED